MNTVFFLNGTGSTPRTYVTTNFEYGGNHHDAEFNKMLKMLNEHCDPESIGWDYVNEETANRWKQSNA
jgi:hypothetical protein